MSLRQCWTRKTGFNVLRFAPVTSSSPPISRNSPKSAARSVLRDAEILRARLFRVWQLLDSNWRFPVLNSFKLGTAFGLYSIAPCFGKFCQLPPPLEQPRCCACSENQLGRSGENKARKELHRLIHYAWSLQAGRAP